MAKRLQVILADPQYREIQRAAKARRMSLAEWVRQALDLARRSEPSGAIGAKLGVIRAAARNQFPAADIGQMLADIDAGYRPWPGPGEPEPAPLRRIPGAL